jgi:enoyl-CoA hydratase
MTGTVRTEVDGRICRIVVDNVAKKNAFTPDMMAELSDAFTAFDADDALWVAVLASTCRSSSAPPPSGAKARPPMSILLPSSAAR